MLSEDVLPFCILSEIALGPLQTYPRATLAQLGPPKHYSDLIESTIGAIFMDSGGCLDACEGLERISLLAYLESFVERRYLWSTPRTRYIAFSASCLTKNEAIVRGADAAVSFLSQS